MGTAPRYLLRDRDRIFGDEVTKQFRDMGVQPVLSAPRSPWQRAYVERVIGTLRRGYLDHVIVFNEASLHRHGIYGNHGSPDVGFGVHREHSGARDGGAAGGGDPAENLAASLLRRKRCESGRRQKQHQAKTMES